MRYLKKLNLQKKKKKHGYHLLGKGWDRKLYFGDHTVSVWEDEKDLEMGDGSGCVTVQMCFTKMNCTC